MFNYPLGRVPGSVGFPVMPRAWGVCEVLSVPSQWLGYLLHAGIILWVPERATFGLVYVTIISGILKCMLYFWKLTCSASVTGGNVEDNPQDPGEARIGVGREEVCPCCPGCCWDPLTGTRGSGCLAIPLCFSNSPYILILLFRAVL